MTEFNDQKVVKFPITNQTRHKNSLGVHNVECIVSGRILSFNPESVMLGEQEVLTVDVLSAECGEDGLRKKLCGLIIEKEELIKALDHIKVKQE